MARLLVYGWYGHSNVGDELMAAALKQLLSEHELAFVDRVTASEVAKADVILIGGGSFLYAPIRGDERGKQALRSKPVVYVGVGSETDIHPDHVELLKLSVAAFTRSKTPSAAFTEAAPHAITLPDLTMSLRGRVNATPTSARELLFIPNAELVPTRSAPGWKKPAWEYFKSEASQAIDELVADGWTVTMAPFSDAPGMRDVWAAGEIVAMCDKRWKVKSLDPDWIGDGSFESITRTFTQASVVLTQRFHGAVIAAATQTPCVIVHHHSKLEQLDTATKLPYYGVRKDLILASVRSAAPPSEAVDPSAFSIVRDAVRIALGE